MSPAEVFAVILFYFALLLLVAWITSRKASNFGFFLGNRKSPWYVVAIGMIGSSISGVTFVSVPGWVASTQFSYLQMVLGYLLGYAIIASFLLPLYYRLNLTSIYGYLEHRFGKRSYKTGAVFFLISRTIGSAFRLYLMASVLQVTIFSRLQVPFWITVVITLALILLYTFRGGIKTIIWTDMLQALLFIGAVVVCILAVAREMHLDFSGVITSIAESKYSRIFFFDEWTGKHFFQQFFSGAFIAIAMIGLDQDMMQKNLSCRNLKEAQKNMYWYSFALVPVNLLFLSLGALLYLYADWKSIPRPALSDDFFPMMVSGGYLPHFASVMFMLGIIAAAYSSADSALTALTTSFTVDILNAGEKTEQELKRIRQRVHIFITLVLLVIILIFRAINNQSVISAIFTVAGYTYGPLLGFFAFGLLTRWKIRDAWAPWVAIASPVICLLLERLLSVWFTSYRLGYELLILNGLLTFAGLYFLRIKNPQG